MLTPEDVMRRAAVPPVSADDVKRLWTFMCSAQAETRSGGAVSYDASLIAQQFSPGTDSVAVFFRTALISALLEAGSFNEFRDGDQVRPVLLEAIADFPLPDGIQKFDGEAFLKHLSRRAA